MPDFPTGVITLVFTDIEGSSDLWERHRAEFQAVLQEHNRLLRAAAANWYGVEVKTEGDAFFLVFAKASDAVCFTLEAQKAIAACPWENILPGLKALWVRIGMHTGETILSAHPNGTVDYFGPTVNRAARVGAAGHGGQVIVSEATRTLALADLPPGISWLDFGDHRLKGVGEEHLWQMLHPDLRRDFPPLKTLDAQRHNLPLSPNPFIGRETETERLRAALLQPATRLLTLTGFGGFGKTRLALQLAELCIDEFSDGVWWVELEEAHDANSMMQRIASELRLHLHPQPTVREQLLEFHRDRCLLLVLDNLEQISDAAKPIDELLKIAPRVKCLVTTRRALELRIERVEEIRPLPLSDAESLFVERARERVASFELTDGNKADVAELCRRLEGVPLAIELAASRIAGMSPREIVSRLDEQLRILQTRAPELPPRQRALRSAIDWSHDLLTPEDQALLAQLSVFSGGFTTSAAEEVCDAFDVFESITELRRHSLLWTETHSDTQQTRFMMLASVHNYAQEKLAEQPNASAFFRRHTDYFLRFAEEQIQRLHTRSEPEALRELGRELDNLRAAIKWTHSAGEKELCARLALALHYALYRQGFWTEALEYLQRGLEEAREEDLLLQAVRAKLLLHYAGLEYDMGDTASADAKVKASLAIYRGLNDTNGQADGLNLLGLLATEAERFDVAQNLFQKSLALRAPEDHHSRAVALHNLGRVATQRGDMSEAQRLFEEALTQRRASGYALGEAETLAELGVIAFNLKDYLTARRFYGNSLALRRQLNDRLGIALMLYNLAEIAEIEGNFQSAVTLFVHTQRIFRDLRSAFAGAAQDALESLQTKLGTEAFSSLHCAAESSRWEEFVTLPVG